MKWDLGGRICYRLLNNKSPQNVGAYNNHLLFFMSLRIDWVFPHLVLPGLTHAAVFSWLPGLGNKSWPCSYVWWLVLATGWGASVLLTGPPSSSNPD